MAKVVIKILQGSAVHKPRMPKIVKIGGHYKKLWQKLAGLLFGPPCKSVSIDCLLYCAIQQHSPGGSTEAATQ